MRARTKRKINFIAKHQDYETYKTELKENYFFLFFFAPILSFLLISLINNLFLSIIVFVLLFLLIAITFHFYINSLIITKKYGSVEQYYIKINKIKKNIIHNMSIEEFNIINRKYKNTNLRFHLNKIYRLKINDNLELKETDDLMNVYFKVKKEKEKEKEKAFSNKIEFE